MRRILLSAALSSLFLPAPALALSHHGWNQASSIARDGLVAVAFGLPAINGDWRGVEQSGLSVGAAFVGVSRVEAKKHFVGDVLVGAAIGEGSGWLLTSKRDARVQWLPWGDAHGGGVSAGMRF